MHTFTEFYKENRADVDAVLFDVDGTLAVGCTPLPGALELLELLKKDHCPFFLLTNDSCRSLREKARLMQGANLPVGQENILSAGNALQIWAERFYTGGLYYLCGSLGDPCYALDAGIEVTRDPALAPACCGIIMGEGRFEWKLQLETVFNMLLKRPDLPVICVNPDSYWPQADGINMGVGGGGFTRFLCALLKDAGHIIEPVYLGKPYSFIYECVSPFVEKNFPGLQIREPRRVMMVGDSLASDIRGGNGAGFTTCLVLTGITSLELAQSAENERKPEYIFKSV
ncbi:MAG: HAD-IIA family hydrolase [Lentisphaeria bacterium]|nr:HAD-IIA family hydrolase [Lentisphaeria bacterium]